MSRDFELIRISDNLDKLKRERDQLKFSLSREQRNELIELEKVRRIFSSNITAIQTKQKRLDRDIISVQLKFDQAKAALDVENKREAAKEQRIRDEERRSRLNL